MNEKLIITRRYTTDAGRCGISYRIGDRRGATFIPARLAQGSLEKIARAVFPGCDATPVRLFQQLDVNELARLVGKAPYDIASQALSDARGRVREMSVRSSTVRAEIDNARVTYHIATHQHSCTCGKAGVCQHLLVLARVLLDHAQTPTRSMRGELVLGIPAVSKSLVSKVMVRVSNTRPGALEIKASTWDAPMWVPTRDVVCSGPARFVRQNQRIELFYAKGSRLAERIERISSRQYSLEQAA